MTVAPVQAIKTAPKTIAAKIVNALKAATVKATMIAHITASVSNVHAMIAEKIQIARLIITALKEIANTSAI